MILEKQKEAKILQSGESSESIAMSLDMDSAQILMQMLSKNLYSDDVGSTIRETASNALDSHRRINDDETPIIVSLELNKEGNYEFTVEDFGTGLDDEDVRNIISKYGKSTKRNSANELGMMGLGFKAPLAYASSFYFVARKNGKERKYIMYENEDGNSIDLLYETDTKENNGVKVIVPVKREDVYQFENKIKEQLCYFENVYFKCNSIENGFNIYRGEHFQYSAMCRDNKLHVCLDNVYYPLDFKKLGIGEININIGIRLSLTDGVFPTPNRESLRYTQDAKQTILSKIKLIADTLVTKYNEKIVETKELKDLYNYFENSNRIVEFDFGGININSILKYSNIKLNKIKYKDAVLIDTETLYKALKSGFNKYYILKFYFDGSRVYDVDKSGYKHRFNFAELIGEGRCKMYSYTDSIRGIQKDYVRWSGGLGLILKKPNKPFKLKHTKISSMLLKDQSLYEMLNLSKVAKKDWRVTIQEYYKHLDKMFEQVINLKNISYPQDFLDSRKKQTNIKYDAKGNAIRKKKKEGEILCKIAEPLQRYVEGKNCKFSPHSIFLEKLNTYKRVFVYTTHDKSDDLQPLYKVSESHYKISFLTFSDREIKNIEEEPSNKLIPFETFMKGKTKHFQRIATVIYIKNFLNDNYSIRSRKEFFRDLKTDLYEDIRVLENYLQKYSVSLNSTIEETILDICEKNYLLDPNIIEVVNRIKYTMNKVPYLNGVFNSLSYGGEPTAIKQCLSDVFRYKKIRMDLKMYNTKLSKGEES